MTFNMLSSLTGTGRVAAALTISAILFASTLAAAQDRAGAVAGSVSVTAPDGSALAMPGVTITLTCGTDQPRTEVSDERGEFHFAAVVTTTGSCSIAAELQGFKSATTAVAVKTGEASSVSLRLDLDTLREEVTVRAPSAPADDRPASAALARITPEIMRAAPLAGDRFQDALPLIPGVVRGPDGLLNVSGTRSNQSALMFNSADGTDPVTGEDAIELPIDAVSAIQVRGAAFAPEFGLSTGAVTTVETQRAGDSWQITVNDLEPRPRRRAGEFRGIESWTPRFTTGGPIVAGKVSFLESVQYEYSQTRVFGLPAFESDTELQSFESYSRVDWSLAATNHFTGSVMVSPRKTTYAGLNTFIPQPVTPVIS